MKMMMIIIFIIIIVINDRNKKKIIRKQLRNSNIEIDNLEKEKHKQGGGREDSGGKLITKCVRVCVGGGGGGNTLQLE